MSEMLTGRTTRPAGKITRHHARKGQRITVRLNDGTVIAGTLQTWDRIAVRVRTDDLRIAERSAAEVWYAETA
jgi:hypothetical protein